MKILVFNAGSSTLKFSLCAVGADETVLADGQIDWSNSGRPAGGQMAVYGPGEPQLRTWPAAPAAEEAGAREILQALAGLDPPLVTREAPIAAVGHRVVHGGTVYRESVRLDAAVRAEIERLAALAPLHNPPALAGMRAVDAALPGVPQVAVFDTAFHATLAPAAYIYPLPYAWYTEHGVRRFGFHGISHGYCAGRAAALLGRPLTDLRLITCHLGSGCSLAAIRGGRSMNTTMGFTPLDGLMMGTRAGAVDPGALIYMLRRPGMDVAGLEDALTHGAGLLGVSGISADLRAVQAAAAAGDERARLAIDIFVARVRSGIAALAADLGGLDALIFTAGIGEHAAAIRQAVCAPLAFMGVALDEARNATVRADAEISLPGSGVRVLVVHTEEDRQIARETARIVGQAPA